MAAPWAALIVLSCVLWSSLPVPSNAVSPAWAIDPRFIGNGSVMLEDAYLDQPYCTHNQRGEWVCVITADSHHEGGPGEHMLVLRSSDQGATWTTPVMLEPESTLTNAYGNIAHGPGDRLYSMYNMNLDNVTTLPDGTPLGRTDELGYFVMKYSDDGGVTWSAEHLHVPFRQTPIDANNSFAGKTDIMWSVDQAKVVNGETYYAFTKIGAYPQSPPEEVWFMVSPNMLTESDPTKVTWELRPNASHGLEVPPPGQYYHNIMEEGHIVPMPTSGGFYAMARTDLGYLAASNTPDPTANSGWARPSGYAAYWAPGSGPLKNPRGPITPKQFANSQYLLLYYFNSETGFDDAGALNSRNPYWLASGRETKLDNGTSVVLWSQPEIIIYDREFAEKRGPGYPDFIQQPDGSVYITETQKSIARVHKVPSDLLHGLWTQYSVDTLATARLALTVTGKQAGTRVPLPAALFPDWTAYAGVGYGFAIDMWLDISTADPGAAGPASSQRVLDFRPAGCSTASTTCAGVVLTTTTTGGTAAATPASLTLTMTDTAGGSFAFTLDAACASRLTSPPVHASGNHYVAFIADGGPLIVSAMVDGVLCDGGTTQQRGWSWFPDTLGDVNGGTQVLVAGDGYSQLVEARVYTRYIRTSEAVGNFRAGPSSLESPR